MKITAAGAVLLPERLGKSARIRVLMLASDRNSLKILLAFQVESVGWSSSSGLLKLEKRPKSFMVECAI